MIDANAFKTARDTVRFEISLGAGGSFREWLEDQGISAEDFLMVTEEVGDVIQAHPLEAEDPATDWIAGFVIGWVLHRDAT